MAGPITTATACVDRDGQPLALTLIVPTTSAIRQQMALMVQEQLRALGVRLELEQMDSPL